MENETLAFEKHSFINRSENAIDIHAYDEVMFTQRLLEDESQNAHTHTHSYNAYGCLFLLDIRQKLGDEAIRGPQNHRASNNKSQFDLSCLTLLASFVSRIS